MNDDFYGPHAAAIHHERFGMLADSASVALLEDLARQGHTRGTVVDLGCGTGLLARAACDAGYTVVGVDLSPAMLDLAREHAPTASLSLGSVHDVELPAGCVAVAAVGEVLNYATDVRAGLDLVTAVE